MAVAEVTKTTSNIEGGGEAAPSFIERVKEYIESLKKEMRLVSWPTRPQVQATTAVVIGTIFAFAAFFWIVDMAIGQAVTKVFQVLSR